MSASSATHAVARAAPPVRTGRVFVAFVARDLRVVFRKQPTAFLTRVLVEPLTRIFVFSYVLPSVSGRGQQPGGSSFSTVLAPGMLATSMLFAGVLGVAMPMIGELTYPKTVQDRLLTPAPVWAVGAARAVSGAVQALVSVLLVLPIVMFVHAPGQAPDIHVANWPLLAVVVFFGSVLSGVIGLWLGTAIQPAHVSALFGLVMMPAMMLGCVYYPWASLAAIPWLHMLVLLNPVMYLSEGLRAVLTPGAAHLPLWAVLLALVGGSAVVGALSLRSFRRAAMD
ncbi:ABC transporter permease [Streptomyces morookaense]|uniref:ABC transporter permease n=1 Tax=Streptomyces morookaense TaxID=1970 RepID=UPI003406CDB0